MVLELTRIVGECEGQGVEDTFKDDVDESLEKAEKAIKAFRRLPPLSYLAKGGLQGGYLWLAK
ncbi:hypothetical protein FRC00_010312 [Tulasnella sp. 408]|nr:hypothetical protein FRC00_010312 [Tulasnella sp. 408]